MKTVTITDIMVDFLDSIRAYEYESGEVIYFDERESSEFVDMYFNGAGKINIEKSNADGENNQKQIMKKYRLKQWYPSLPKDWVVGDVAIPWEKQKYYYHIPNKSGIVFKEEVEDNPDFWELIEEKKPLFTTEDKVGIFRQDELLTVAFSDFTIGRYLLGDILNFPLDDLSYKDIKVFSNDDSAIDYIWRNKRLFSYNDIEKFQSGGEGVFYDVKVIAKERSKV